MVQYESIIVASCVQAEHRDKKGGQEIDLKKFVRDPAMETPQQLNGSDCGVFLCKVGTESRAGSSPGAWLPVHDSS